MRVSASVIERMSVDVMRGFGATRRRGTEVGGILLGRIEFGSPATVFVQDYEEVSCEYAFGPSYALSDNDRAAFRQAAGRWSPGPGKTQYTVGIFRSHTRDGLSLDEGDAGLFTSFVPGGEGVALLVKPYASRTSRASFFLSRDGRLDTDAAADEFPFTAQPGGVENDSESTPVPAPAPARRAAPVTAPVPAPVEAAPPPVIPVAPVKEPPAEVPAIIQPPVPPPRKPTQAQKLLVDVLGPRGGAVLDDDDEDDAAGVPTFGAYQPRRRSRWKRLAAWMAFACAVFAFGVVLGFQYAGGRTPAIVFRGAPPPPPPPDPYAAGLAVEKQGSGLLVRWNRDAAIVQSAHRGLLLVSEKRGSKEVKLGYAELRNGTVIYQNVAPEITFRLELFLDGTRTFIETTTWRTPEPAASPRGPSR